MHSSARVNSYDSILIILAISLIVVMIVPLVNSGLTISTAEAASPSEIYFGVLPPHAALPSGGACAQLLVGSSTWEPRPENARANTAIVPAAELAAFHAQPLNFVDGPPASDFQAVDGNYSGTTDMIIRWAACKWGMDENVLRAEAFLESDWSAYRAGDLQFSQYLCEAGDWNGWQPAGYCWETYGISQAKLMSYNAWPMAWTSTAFNLDLRAAYWRACMNGDVQYYNYTPPMLGYPAYSSNADTTQMEWGCVGSWYSGQWYDAAALTYIAVVQGFVATAPWRNLPSGSSPALSIITPGDTQKVAGVVSIAITLDQSDPKACYACLSIDGMPNSCVPATGPWYWDTTQYVLNGMHAIGVDAYRCDGSGPNYHAGIDVTVAN
jgi:hypothetical protein